LDDVLLLTITSQPYSFFADMYANNLLPE